MFVCLPSNLYFSLLLDDLQKMADKLRDEIREIKNLRQAQENELATIENAALKQRFQMALSKLVAQEQEKKEEVIVLLFINQPAILTSIFILV